MWLQAALRRVGRPLFSMRCGAELPERIGGRGGFESCELQTEAVTLRGMHFVRLMCYERGAEKPEKIIMLMPAQARKLAADLATAVRMLASEPL